MDNCSLLAKELEKTIGWDMDQHLKIQVPFEHLQKEMFIIILHRDFSYDHCLFFPEWIDSFPHQWVMKAVKNFLDFVLPISGISVYLPDNRNICFTWVFN